MSKILFKKAIWLSMPFKEERYNRGRKNRSRMTDRLLLMKIENNNPNNTFAQN